MRTFAKVQTTSLAASVVDFLTTVVIVQWWHYWFIVASVLGAVSGGLVSFGVSKKWVFADNKQPIGPQFGRFVLVWLGNAGLNAGGLFVATQFMDVQYLVAKTTVAVLVGVSYNYVLQKDFVFSLS
ncbi:GtrA family protein [Fibrella aquatica]|uniref:GtrA family protein n=1 Tax=Fibrella aquatica TaxID=3242487 RepID=UPI00352058D2